jgi:hypothetical protein
MGLAREEGRDSFKEWRIEKDRDLSTLQTGLRTGPRRKRPNKVYNF